MANAIRALAMDAVQKANSGHPGMPMGMADVATVLYTQFLKYDPKNPAWHDRDRFVLSAGHGSMLLYALNYLTGYEKMTLEEIKNFRQLHALTAGHPEVHLEAGIETTTGPLGQGIATAVGMAMAEQMLNARFGDDIVDHHTYVIVGDGCMQEGISHEAASLAGHLGLSKLIVLYDDNEISIDGATSLSFSDDTLKRFDAYGWNVARTDGHDPQAVTDAIAKARQSKDKPTLIACRTQIGYGAPTKAGTKDCHGSPLGDDEIKGAREKLGWAHVPFDIPSDILTLWRDFGKRSRHVREAWDKRLAALDMAQKANWDAYMNDNVTAKVDAVIREFKAKMTNDLPKMATRQASGKALEVLVPALPQLIGGSADLTGSNLTLVKDKMPAIKRGDFSGRYVYYGVREHGMAAAMNGMALHGGVIPYGGTFMTFTDYCRPSIRLSALMKQRVIYVMTHDSIGLGEDGPTHQPVEHVASLRAMPNVLMLRPADVIETAECWQIALEHTSGPSVLALTRQNIPTLRGIHTTDNLCRRGAYILQESNHDLDVTIFATGSEVEIALEAKYKLEQDNIGVRVVSVPSFELFRQQDESYRNIILRNGSVKVGIEAGMRFGWDSLIGNDGIFVGMDSFGESAPYEQLYRHFGITADDTVKRVKQALK